MNDILNTFARNMLIAAQANSNAVINTPHQYVANTAYHPSSAPCKVCSQSQYGNPAHR